MAANDRPFMAGVPWGISESTATWPGVSPGHVIYDPTNSALRRERQPLRYQSSIETVSTTRVLPNGVRIDKFQGYRAPVPTAEETWRWVIRNGSAHGISGDYGGYELATRYMHGMVVGLYILEVYDHPPIGAQRWTAQARWEGLSVDNEPQYLAGFAVYTARFVRLTEWNFINGPVTIS